MHASGWIHRDVKTANVMLDQDMRGVLIDFSLTKHLDEQASREIRKLIYYVCVSKVGL